MTIKEALSWAKERLLDGSLLDARLLLSFVLKKDKSYLFGHPEDHLSADHQSHFCALIERRSKGEPVSRIIGEREFWSLPFKISPATLDPRPDSETLIEAVLRHYPDQSAPLSFLDLGTGSGCLLLTLLHVYKEATGVGIDKSEKALEIASLNSHQLGVSERSSFLCGSWGEPLNKKFDVIVSNPPYIPRADISDLSTEVRLFDPYMALEGGEDGLDAYRELLAGLPDLLKEEGRVFIEIGQGQDGDLILHFQENGWEVVDFLSDISGVCRILCFKSASTKF